MSVEVFCFSCHLERKEMKTRKRERVKERVEQTKPVPQVYVRRGRK
jgi:hypothetical protein